MIRWLLLLVSLATGAYAATEVLRLTCPHLSTRDRWVAVFWTVTVIGSVRFAWIAGEPT